MKRGTPRHPKTLELIRILDQRPHSLARVVGYLELLWHFTAEFAPQGDIGRFSDDRIEAALDWSGPRGKLLSALREAGWVSESPRSRLVVHDWHDHCDDSVRKRLSRAHLPFLSLPEEMTGQRQTFSATQDENGSLPSPMPRPKPEPIPQTPNAADAACSVNGNSHEGQTALDLPGVVRPDVPAPAKAKKRKTGKRSTEEIEHALGSERLVWWHKFWEVFPCHEGMNPAMDAFERKAQNREIALAMHAGAKRYAAKVAAAISRGEDIRMKWGQGWINDERWKDEDAAPPVPERKEPKFFDTKALRETETPVPPGWKVGM